MLVHNDYEVMGRGQRSQSPIAVKVDIVSLLY